MNNKIVCSKCPSYSKSIFSSLAVKENAAFDSIKHSNRYSKGQVIFSEGNFADAVFCVRSGAIKLCREGPAGKRYILNIIKDGDFIGYPHLYNSDNYKYSAVAVTETVVCHMEKKKFVGLLSECNEICKSVARNAIVELSGMLDQFVELLNLSAHSRLVKLLLSYCDNFGRKTSEGIEIDLPLSRKEIGESIGTTKETAIRLLNMLKRQKVLSFRRNVIIVRDAAHLADRLSRMN